MDANKYRKLLDDFLSEFMPIIKSGFNTMRKNTMRIDEILFLVYLNPLVLKVIRQYTEHNYEKNIFQIGYSKVKDTLLNLFLKGNNELDRVVLNIYEKTINNVKLNSILNFIISYYILLHPETYSILPIHRTYEEYISSYALFSRFEEVKDRYIYGILREHLDGKLNIYKAIYETMQYLREYPGSYRLENFLNQNMYDKFSEELNKYYVSKCEDGKIDVSLRNIKKKYFKGVLKKLLRYVYKVYQGMEKKISEIELLKIICNPGLLGELYVYRILRDKGFLVFPEFRSLYQFEIGHITDKEVDGILLIPRLERNKYVFKMIIYEVTTSKSINKTIDRVKKLKDIIKNFHSRNYDNVYGAVFTRTIEENLSEDEFIKVIQINKIHIMRYLMSKFY